MASFQRTSSSITIASRKCSTDCGPKGVLRDAEFVYNNAVDVSIDMYGTKAAAVAVYRSMQERGHSRKSWGEHELHPSPSEGFDEVDIVNFVFTMDLLNFWFVIQWLERGHCAKIGRAHV